MLISISDNAGLQDTIKLIIQTINSESKSEFVQNLTRGLHPSGSKMQFVKRLFDKICAEIKYVKDPDGHEIVATPAAMFREARGDCKKMTTTIAAILKSVGIHPLLAVISYDGEKYEHIFPLVKINSEFITLDPVNNCQFNKIIPHKKAVVYNLKGNAMQLSLLNGPGNNKKKSMFSNVACDFNRQMNQAAGVGFKISDKDTQEIYNLSGIEDLDLDYDSYLGRRRILQRFVARVAPGRSIAQPKTKEQRKERRKAIFKKVVHFVKQTNPVALQMRAAFLGVIAAGKGLEKVLKIHLAQRMAEAYKQDPARVEKLWNAFGGDTRLLKAAIVKGSGVSLGGADLVLHTDANMNLQGIGSIAAVAAGVTAATPIIIAVMKMLKDMKVVQQGSAEDQGAGAATDAAEDAYNDDGSNPNANGADGGNGGGADGFSLHQGTINNFSEFINFCKGAGVANMGAQLHPGLALPTALVTAAAFLYAMRKQINKLFTLKTA